MALLVTGGEGRVGVGYCTSQFAIIKWLEIAFSCIILALSLPGVNIWEGYTYMFSVGCIGLIFVFLSLVYYTAGVHRRGGGLPSMQVELFMNVLLMLMNIAVFGLAVYDASKMGRGIYTEHNFPSYPGRQEWHDYMATISAFSILNAILFFISCGYADQATFRTRYW